MTDPTDPTKALREWCAMRDTEREYVAECIDHPHGFLDDATRFGVAKALLSSAPALLAALARLEKAEGLLWEARERLDLADAGDTARRITASIDAFLAPAPGTTKEDRT